VTFDAEKQLFKESPLVYIDDLGLFNQYSRSKRRRVVPSDSEEKYIESQRVLGNKAIHSGKDFTMAIYHYSLGNQLTILLLLF